MSCAPISHTIQEWSGSTKGEFSAGWKGGGDWTKPLAPMSPFLTADLVETDQDYQIIADAPGVQPDGLEVNLHDNVVSIKADRKNTYKKDTDKLHVLERTYGVTTRNFQLPMDADIGQSSVTVKDGVLHVVFHKLAGQPPIGQKELFVTHE